MYAEQLDLDKHNSAGVHSIDLPGGNGKLACVLAVPSRHSHRPLRAVAYEMQQHTSTCAPSNLATMGQPAEHDSVFEQSGAVTCDSSSLQKV